MDFRVLGKLGSLWMRGPVICLFTGIEGSPRLLQELGQPATLD
jgi:hypothetical protein